MFCTMWLVMLDILIFLFDTSFMKYRFYAITLLMVLIFNIFRFTVPYIQYAFFKTYIAKNLCEKKDEPKSCCEGKCFREKQINSINETQDTDTPNQKESSKTTQKNEVKEFLLVHSILPVVEELFLLFFSSQEMKIYSRYLSAIFIPPQV